MWTATKWMFEIIFLRTDAGPNSLRSFIDGLINDNLTEVWPDLNEKLFQLIDIIYMLRPWRQL